jgi:hypothetical protein
MEYNSNARAQAPKAYEGASAGGWIVLVEPSA